MRRYNEEVILSEELLSDIATYMDNDLREKVHFELAPCEPMTFLKRYLELDPDFEMLLFNEFGIEFQEDGIMFNILNVTTKEQFKLNMDYFGYEVAKESENAWKVKDKYNHVYIVEYDSDENRWSISSSNEGIIDTLSFKVYMIFNDSSISILWGNYGGKTCRAERSLKRFMQLAIMLNNLYIFGYFDISKSKVIGIMLQHTDGDKEYYEPELSQDDIDAIFAILNKYGDDNESIRGNLKVIDIDEQGVFIVAIKLAEHTNGNHIYMRMRLDNGRTEEIDVYLGRDGNTTYKTSADHGMELNPAAHEATRKEIIEAFNELY